MSNSAKFDSTIKTYLHILISFFFVLNLSAKSRVEDSLNMRQSSHVLFTKNKGQWHQNVLYQGKFKGGKVFLENKAFTFLFYPSEGLDQLHYKLNNPNGFSDVLNFHTVKMEFVNANEINTKLEVDSNAFYENFYLGNDSRHWATHVKSFKQVHYQSLYNNITLKTISDKNNFRFDLLLNPGANVNDIALKFTGQNSLRLSNGNLMIGTEVGEMTLTAPKAYQIINGKTVKVNCDFRLVENQVDFVLGNYNQQFPVIIDPTLVCATYTGSQSDNFGMTATYDLSGNAYTAGVCFGPYYPVTTGAFQITFMGPTGINPGTDISISKFNPTGTNLLYSTYLGGGSYEAPQSIVVDNANELVVFGRTASTNFPVTNGVFQSVNAGNYDFIVSKFNINGTALSASTYMGGTAKEGVNGTTNLSGLHYNYSDDLRGGVIVDANNNIYFGACTSSSDFPVTAGCLQGTLNGSQDACIVKFDPSLTAPIYSTFLGGAMQDAVYSVAINSSNQLYITGGTESSDFPSTPGTIHSTSNGAIDGFVGLLSASGNNLLRSTYIGTGAYDQSYFVQLDNQNKVYILGQTEGAYPVSSGVYTNPSSGQFIHCMNANLTSTYFTTVIGRGTGFPDIVPSAFMVDVCGNIYLSGWGGPLQGNNNSHSSTSGLPVTSNAFMPVTDNEDFYFMVLNKDALSLQYASFFGGNQSHEHVDGGTSRFDKAGVIYQAICESCGGHDDMPTTPGAWSSTNNSSNCNNAVVKFAFTPNLVAAQLSTDPGILTGCAPFTVDFLNHSINGVDYFWTFGDGASSALFEPTHTYTTAGTFQVRLISHNNATCNIFDTTYITVNVLPPLILNPLQPESMCKGDTVQINFDAPSGSTYTWSPNSFIDNTGNMQPNVWPPTNQTYYVAIEKNGCMVKDSILISVFENTTKIVFDSAHICLDDTVKLYASQVNSSYQWSNGQTTQSIEILDHGWYYLNVIDSNGCKALDSIKVDSLHRVPLTSYTMAICSTDKMQLIAPQGNYVYEWTPLKNISSYNIYNPFVNPLSSTVYTLTLFNGPCISKATYDVSVFPMPSLTVTPKSSEILPGEMLSLYSISDTVASWYPDYTLSCQQCNVVIVSPDVNTIYYALVANAYGCKRIDSVEVRVTPSLYIPNSFTPNGDLVNDIFRPVFSGYTEIELLIFDRWGELIFRTDELNGGWDGTRKNVNCPMDVYVYKLTAKDYKNKTIEKVGHVTLVR